MTTSTLRPRRLISLLVYEDQLTALDRRARAAERSRSAELRCLIDASLSEPPQAAPATKQQEADRAS